MKKLTLILFLAIAKMGFAQQDTTITYLNAKGYPTKKITDALFINKIFKIGEAYVLENYDKQNGFLVKREVFEDKALTIKSGRHELYRNGKLILKANYKKNHRNGSYIRLDTSGTIITMCNYLMDSLHGSFTSYWQNGMKKEYGYYLNGKKVGYWFFKYENDSLAIKESYTEDAKLIDSIYLDEQGKPTSRTSITTLISFSGGANRFYEFIAHSIRYPREALINKIQGTVKVFLIIDDRGKIIDLDIESSPHYSLSDETVRVLKSYSKWIPATFLKKPIYSDFFIPVSYWTP